MPTYRVQILRNKQTDFIVYYLQVNGELTEGHMSEVQGEMFKAWQRLQSRYRKEEVSLHTYQVYEESFDKWLRDMGQEQAWQQLWRFPVYSDYHNSNHLKTLLQTIPRKEFPKQAMILGCGVGIKEWLPLIAGQVQTMELYVEFMTRGLEELREKLCEEYGMVTDLKLVAPGEFAKERLRSREPVLVIDFSQSKTISVLGLARGSIWVDMDAVETKRHLIEDRPTGVQYLSLKTFWKREMSQTLDTISKFAYNTEVKIGRI